MYPNLSSNCNMVSDTCIFAMYYFNTCKFYLQETNEMCEMDPAVAQAMKKLRFNKDKICAAVIGKW